ncbi:chromosomal replication initiator protein DnaA [Granulicella sibirica]|uniref:Chromosomal replication initiator protein DnaA n=1 Tax=Granulicella sibirica TaxID=2479048 RepID=A0A4Q0TA13_9BACT|nr:chromosomal replication initiator protein DnaA [Granulicella sibirica]RXH58471.1 Chromosomal replication initiator protein DnaA [Granulicella sibirica]
MSFVPTAAAVLNSWVRILGALEKKINRQSFETWLKPTRFSHIAGRTLFVRIPSVEFEKVGEKYADLIQEAIDNLQLDIDDVTFQTPQQDPSAPRVREDGGFAPLPSHSLNAPRPSRPGAPAQAGIAAPEQARFDWNAASQLNPRYQFDAFVIGSGNQFAMAASQAVAERPSKAYNPLFLYGGVGMGKTHLMHAIGHDVKRRQPHASICYVSGEKFTNEMINSVRYDKMTSFRDKFRNVDVLLIDDIQFLAGKERTQEEFFHTFNTLHESMKQIVIASDRPPKELADFEDRLRSRFEWGLIADIQPPDLETKVAILQKKAESEQTQLPTDVALFIASNVRTNVRELEGALVRLIAWCSMHGVEITMAVTQQCLKQFIDTQVRKITIEAIQRAVAEHFGMRVAELKQKNNSRQIVVPRQIAMYLAKQMTEASLPEIGRQFGGKHHTTVMHSIGKIDEQRRTDKDLNRTINKLMETLN